MENENKELELSERQLTILDAIIRNYLTTGEPVGSRTISKYTDLNLSSATIRNEMSDLEEMGYIVQPHTSAGRIPSDKGYRLYVDHLIETNDKKEKELSDMKELVIENTEKMEQVLKQAAKDIRKRIEKTQARLNRIQKGGTVLDSVSGTRADGTIGSIRIEGFPFGDFNKQWEYLNRYAESLSAAEAKLLEQTAEVEQYIRTIEDSRMRRIIQYRVIDGLSWYEVADRIGGKATSESCRKYFERFLGKC